MVKRHKLSGKDVKELAKVLNPHLAELLKSADDVEIYEVSESLTLYLLDYKPLIMKISIDINNENLEYIVPTLITLNTYPKLREYYPQVVVDDGAVPKIINGADVMRPGIKDICGDFRKNDIILVRDFRNRIISLGIAMYNRSEVESMSKGKVIKNIHYLGDKIWKLCEELIKTSKR